MTAKIHTAARALVALLGMALVGACGTRTPASTANALGASSAGELSIEWQPRPPRDEALPEVQVEIRSVEGTAPSRRRVELRAPDDLQTRLSLPPGVYDVRLTSAVLHPSNPADVEPSAADWVEAQPLQLPPPQIVLVREGALTRARVGLATAHVETLARLQETP